MESLEHLYIWALQLILLIKCYYFRRII